MHFQNFRKAEPWVAFSLYRICNRWFKPCLSDVYRFCLFFLKNCDEWIKYKWISWFLESPDLIFLKKYFPLRQVLIYKILQGCLGILPWHCETQNLMSANKWKVIAVSIMFYQSFLCPVLCSPSVSFWVANSSLRPLHNLTAL